MIFFFAPCVNKPKQCYKRPHDDKKQSDLLGEKMNRVMIISPEGDEIELVAAKEEKLCEGARLGAQALLDLLQDEMDLEDGYKISLQHDATNNEDHYSHSLH